MKRCTCLPGRNLRVGGCIPRDTVFRPFCLFSGIRNCKITNLKKQLTLLGSTRWLCIFLIFTP